MPLLMKPNVAKIFAILLKKKIQDLIRNPWKSTFWQRFWQELPWQELGKESKITSTCNMKNAYFIIFRKFHLQNVIEFDLLEIEVMHGDVTFST